MSPVGAGIPRPGYVYSILFNLGGHGCGEISARFYFLVDLHAEADQQDQHTHAKGCD